MKRFLATYIGTASASEKSAWVDRDPAELEELQAKGMAAWGEWMANHSASIVDAGAPLGKTKRASADGITDTANTLTAYVIVEAESHEAAARIFDGHPHFSVFPGDSVEIMEILPIPGMT